MNLNSYRFLFTSLLFLFTAISSSAQEAESDTLRADVDSIGVLLVYTEDSSLVAAFVPANSNDTVTHVLLQGTDSVDLDSASMAAVIEDAAIAQRVTAVLREHAGDIISTFDLSKRDDGFVIMFATATEGEGDDTESEDGNEPDPAAATVVDQFSYVMNDIPYDITLQRTLGENQLYQIIFRDDDESKTFVAGKIFYVTYFQPWLDNAFPGVDDAVKTNLINRITENLSRFEVQEAMAQRTEMYTSVIDSLEAEDARPRIGGQLRWNGPWTLPVYNDNQEAFERKNKKSKFVFRVDNVRVYTDYNRISDLRLTGKLINTATKDSVALTFNNRLFSMGFPTLSHINQAFYTQDGDEDLYINPKGVITYEPVLEAYSNNVKNMEVALTRDRPSAILERRTFSDYIGLQVFLDPFGFFNDEPNGFTQLEGAAYVPMNHKNNRRYHWFMKNTTTFSYVFTNAVNNEPRFARLDPEIYQEDNFFGQNVRQPLFNNLDLIRNYFYQLNSKFALLSYEIKGANSWLHFNSGFRVWGSRIGPHRDSLRTHHRLFWEALSVGLEVRPDRPFGLNVDAGFGFLNDVRRFSSNPDFPRNPQFLYEKSVIVPHELNFYHYLNDRRKGGLFFRYAGFLAYNIRMRADPRTNPVLNRYAKVNDYFPMILIGYSTNISALVKGEVVKSRSDEAGGVGQVKVPE